MSAPLHPLFVHFPIALLLVGTLVYLYANFIAVNDLTWRRAAVFMLVFGWSIGLLTVATGALSFRNVPDSHPAHTTGATHALLALITETLYAIGLVLARKPATQRVAVLFFLLGAITLTATGYFGGELVYHWKLGIPS